ncbi:MAG: SDR family NAD(P)-dependent oxidoreductase [Candidatus Geothermincolia bacterium]
MAGKAMITGASSGFGEVYARRLAEKGIDLVIVARRGELLEQLATELRDAHDVTVEVILADLTIADDVSVLERRLAAADITILINNAGFSTDGTFLQGDVSRQVDMIKVHDIAAVRLTHSALPGMIERRSGTVINVASLAGVLPSRFNVVYSASKAFLVSFTEALSHELVGSGINLQALCPSFTHTGFQEAMGHTPDAPWLVWQNSEEVIDESLAGLGARRNLVLVTGTRNKIVTAILNMLPRYLRLRALRIIT